MKRNVKWLTFLLASLILFSATSAWAATVVVGTCMPTRVSYSSLTDAIAGVPAGSTIQVCPGSYAEQLVIDKSLNIKGIASGNNAVATLVSPPGGLTVNAFSLGGSSFYAFGQPFAAQVFISPGVDVTITGITIDGAGAPICGAFRVGILVQNSSATINFVALRNQLEPLQSGCPGTGWGAGVLTQNDTGITPTTIKVSNSSFVSTAQAFESDGAANTSTVNNNFFNGNPGSNANAISILNGVSTVQGNSISNYTYPPAAGNVNNAAFGVFMTCMTSGTVSGNFISNTQVGVFLQNPPCPTSGVSITGNDISGASLIGIDIGQTNGLVQGNDVRTSLTAIRIPGAAAGNVIQNNRINDACAAFGSNPAAGVNNILTNNINNVTNLSIVNSTALCP